MNLRGKFFSYSKRPFSFRKKLWWHRRLVCAGAGLASRLHFFVPDLLISEKTLPDSSGARDYPKPLKIPLNPPLEKGDLLKPLTNCCCKTT
jgi:hypothetical protein